MAAREAAPLKTARAQTPKPKIPCRGESSRRFGASKEAWFLSSLALPKGKKQVQPTTEVLEIDVQQMELQLDQMEAALGEAAARPFRLLLAWHLTLVRLIERKNTTIGRLRRMLFGSSTERTPPAAAGGEPLSPAAASAELADPG